MPIIFNIVFGLPQMLSNIQMIIICVAVRVGHLYVSYVPQ